jgi:hypothetical protein
MPFLLLTLAMRGGPFMVVAPSGISPGLNVVRPIGTFHVFVVQPYRDGGAE